MADFHLSVKAIGRSDGRSATAAAAYRAAERIVDARTGEIHDYTRKAGVIDTALVLPGGATRDRSEFWNAVEQHHKRGDAVLAREFSLALPHELPADERARLAFDFGRELADRYGVAVDVALHEPDKKGDQRNYHAHVMMSACSVAPDGTLGRKAVELDPIHCQRAKIENFTERERPRWAELHNERMAENGRAERIDHRSLEAQGIDREPTRHLGPSATGYERRTGQPSRQRLDFQQAAAERLARAKGAGDLARQIVELDRFIIDLSGDLAAAKADRDRKAEASKQRARAPSAVSGLPAGMAPVQETPAPQTFYGWIVAPEGDRAFLVSRGVELGPYNEIDGKFPVRVDAKTRQELEDFRETFELQLTPLEDSVVDPATQRLGVPLTQVKPETFAGYLAYLRYMVASEQGGARAASALAEASRERANRLSTLASATQRRDVEPGSMEP